MSGTSGRTRAATIGNTALAALTFSLACSRGGCSPRAVWRLSGSRFAVAWTRRWLIGADARWAEWIVSFSPLANVVPRVIAIELGPAALARRIHPILGRWIEGLEHAFGFDEGRRFSALCSIPSPGIPRIPVRVDLTFGETAAATVEHWLRHWVRSIPGS